MAYVFFILETDADQNWPNRHQNAPRGSKNEIKIDHGAPKMKLGTPNGAQRRPKETSEEAKGGFGRAKVDPRAPRCAPREARMPPASAKVVPPEALGEPHGFQDGPREPKEGFRRRINEEKGLQDPKREMLILELFF